PITQKAAAALNVIPLLPVEGATTELRPAASVASMVFAAHATQTRSARCGMTIEANVSMASARSVM
ncbi:MAG: hypothetical protein ACON3Z_11695, partial [Bradymonadia bacterium]